MGILRRRIHVPLLVLAALMIGLGLTGTSAPKACACSCAELTLREHADQADLVAVAVLEGSRPAGSSQTAHTFLVERFHKGSDTGRITVRSARDGASCGLEGLTTGTRYLLFADHGTAGWEASLCGGTRPASAQDLAQLEHLLGAGTPAPTPVTAPGTATARPRHHHWVGIGAGLAGAALVVFVGLRRRRS